jgi:hypothetical protein
MSEKGRQVHNAIGFLASAVILEETSGRKRDMVFVYRKYLDLLREMTELF